MEENLKYAIELDFETIINETEPEEILRINNILEDMLSRSRNKNFYIAYAFKAGMKYASLCKNSH